MITSKVKLSYAHRDESHLVHDSWLVLCRNILISMLIGAIVWAVVAALSRAVEHSTHYLFAAFHAQEKSISTIHSRYLHLLTKGPWVFVIVLLLGAVVRGWMIHWPRWRSVEGDGASDTIHYFLEGYKIDDPQQIVKERYKRPAFLEALRRFIITLITLGSGGSGGLEGPIIPIGESIASGCSRVFKIFRVDDLRAFQLAGIAAAVCAITNTPFAAAIFATEIVYSERIVYRTLLYSIFAVLCAFELNNYFLHSDTLFQMTPHAPSFSLHEYLLVSLVAVICCAPAGLGIQWVLKSLRKLFGHLNITRRAPLGALLIVFIVLGVWVFLGIAPEHVVGMGENTISDLLNNSGSPLLHLWWILLVIIIAKNVATCLTLMTGGSAGLLVPAMVLGGSSGAMTFYLLEHLGFAAHRYADANLFIIAGIASALVAVIEVPIASIVMVIEMFGAVYAPPAMIAVAICHKVMKRLKLYLE